MVEGFFWFFSLIFWAVHLQVVDMALTDELENDGTISTTWATNSTEETPWVEKVFYGGFRVWQVLFLAAGALLAIGNFLAYSLPFHHQFANIENRSNQEFIYQKFEFNYWNWTIHE